MVATMGRIIVFIGLILALGSQALRARAGVHETVRSRSHRPARDGASVLSSGTSGGSDAASLLGSSSESTIKQLSKRLNKVEASLDGVVDNSKGNGETE